MMSSSCKRENPPLLDYKRDARFMIQNLTDYCRIYNKNFGILLYNSPELTSNEGTLKGSLMNEFNNNIDGIIMAYPFFGFSKKGVASPDSIKSYVSNWSGFISKGNIQIYSTDIVENDAQTFEVNTSAVLLGYKPYCSYTSDFSDIPAYPASPVASNNDSIFAPQLARNYIYLKNPGSFNTKHEIIDSLSKVNYDLIILDYYFKNTYWTKQELDSLKIKPGGTRRIVYSYISLLQADDTRYYWSKSFLTNPPLWPGKTDSLDIRYHHVKYWDPDWQIQIFGNDDSYMRKIIRAGFDGILLDRIKEAYQYWEVKKP